MRPHSASTYADKDEQKADVEFILPMNPQDATGVMQVATLYYAESQPDRPTGVSLPRLSIRNTGRRAAKQPVLRFADVVSGLATGAHPLLDTPPNLEPRQAGVAGGGDFHLAPPDSHGKDLLNDIAARGADCAIEINWLTDAAGQSGRAMLYGKHCAQRTSRKQAVLLA